MKDGKTKPGISLTRVLLGVFGVAVFGGWTMQHANFVLGRSLLLAFPDWEVTYRSAWPVWSGGVVAKNVKLVPPDGESAGTFEFADVRLEVPFFQYYRSGFSRARGALLNSIRDLQLEFHGGHGDLSEPFTRELALFGDVSAAPFEAEGCLGDTAWLETELSDMGLKAGGTDLTLAFHNEDGRVIKEQMIHTPGAGRVELKRELVKHDNFPLFSLIEGGGHELAADEWHLADEGFVAARNRHCAQKDGISTTQFVQRHVQSAKRLLEVVGLAPQPKLEEAYRAYANGGGNLDLSVRYSPPIGAPLYGADDLSGWLPRLQAQFAVNGKSTALTLTSVKPRPLPEIEDASTYDLIQRETAASESIANGSGTGESGNAPPAALSAAASAAATTVAPIPVAAAAPVVMAAAPPKPVAPPAAQTQAPAAFADDPPQLPAGAISNYRGLAAYVGRNLTVHTHDREPIHVQIVRVIGAGGDVLVRRYLRGGAFEYVLDRRSFDYAME